MHSRIFILTTVPKNIVPMLDCEAREEVMPFADYVVDSDNFEKDIGWLNQIGINTEKAEGTTEDDEPITIYKITDTKEFVKNTIESTIEDTKKAYKNFIENPSIMSAVYLARAVHPRDEFHFWIEKEGETVHTFTNSFEFAQFLKANPNIELYIVQSFDYHV